MRRSDIELGATHDGRLVACVDILADMGAYPVGAYLPPDPHDATGRLPIRRRVPWTLGRDDGDAVAEYRSAGRPEAALSIERAMDALADELGLDPVELRRRNLIPIDAFPYETAVGSTYDSGDYERALDEALRLAGYEELRGPGGRRACGDRVALGVGVSCTSRWRASGTRSSGPPTSTLRER